MIQPTYPHHSHIRVTIIGVFLMLLFLAMFFINFRILRKSQAYHVLYEDLIRYEEAGQKLRLGSDNLTFAVRRFSVNAAMEELDAYFHEVNVAKNREDALALLDSLPNGAKVKKELDEAMDYSQRLMDIEYHAMRLLVKPEMLSRSDFPAVVRDYPLSEEELAMSPEERSQKARDLLFGSRYEFFKERIYFHISQIFQRAIQEQKTILNHTIVTQRFLIHILGFTMIGLLLLLIVLSFVVRSSLY
ncbi:MAG: hypothetical protein IJJ26_04875 [Victivallales bacterium]|nr:hypothetical protein [Victivallales bacterium]